MLRRLSARSSVVLLGIFLAAPPSVCIGQPESDDGTNTTVQVDSVKERSRWALLPIIFRSPDTRMAFGVLPQYIFYTAKNTRSSTARVDAYYTQNRQFHLIVRPEVWLPGNAWRLAGRWSVKKWPTSFYGIGTGSLKDDEEGFAERLVDLSFDGQRQFRPGLYVGLRYNFRWGKISDTDEGGLLELGTIPGSTAGSASGVGALVSWDTRDNVNFPGSGSLLQSSASFYGPAIGSDYRFNSYTLDLRRYWTVSGPHVFAVQAIATLTTGEAPFRMLPGVGSQLRGYSSMRYIDNDCLVVQGEYRFVPAWWRLGFTVFGGIGEVADGIENFSFHRPKWAAGVGLRLLLFRKEMITIRQDFAFGRDSFGDYLDLNEAF